MMKFMIYFYNMIHATEYTTLLELIYPEHQNIIKTGDFKILENFKIEKTPENWIYDQDSPHIICAVNNFAYVFWPENFLVYKKLKDIQPEEDQNLKYAGIEESAAKLIKEGINPDFSYLIKIDKNKKNGKINFKIVLELKEIIQIKGLLVLGLMVIFALFYKIIESHPKKKIILIVGILCLILIFFSLTNRFEIKKKNLKIDKIKWMLLENEIQNYKYEN
jgi:hypothetical protein